MRIDQQIEELQQQRTKKAEQMPANFERIIARVKYFLEHLDELLVKQIDPVKKAKLFAAIFTQPPTYDDLKIGTQKTPLFTGVNQIFALAKMEKSLLVTHTSQMWNTLWPSLERVALQLEELDTDVEGS